MGGNITLESLRRSDFGFYQCVATNEVATIVVSTQLVVEGTKPHAPYNLTGTATEFSITLNWLPGKFLSLFNILTSLMAITLVLYETADPKFWLITTKFFQSGFSGGREFTQDYTLWYREAGTSEWATIPVTPPANTQMTINRLAPGTTYEFKVQSKNDLGDGMMSEIFTIRTLGKFLYFLLEVQFENWIFPLTRKDVGLPPVQNTPSPQNSNPNNENLGKTSIILLLHGVELVLHVIYWFLRITRDMN